MGSYSDATDPVFFDVGITGIGPRGASINIYAIIVALAEDHRLHQLHKYGQSIKIRFHSFEQRPWAERAVGPAYSPTCHGLVNTPAFGPEIMTVPNLDLIKPKHSKLVYSSMDLRGQIEEYLKVHWQEIMTEYKRVNLAAAASLQNATRDNGSVDLSLPCITRGTQGIIMQNQFDVVTDGAAENPFVEFHFHYDTEVINYDLATNRFRPTLTARDGKTRTTTEHVFDHIIIAEGVGEVSPLSGAVKSKTYLGQPNFDEIRAFYGNLGLLCDDGTLDPEARVLVLGMSLSAIDKITVGTQAIGLGKLCDSDSSPFEWDNDKLQRYKHTFTTLSRHSTPNPAPKHLLDSYEPGSKPFPLSPLMIRAALMDKNTNALSEALPVVYAAAARALSSVPERSPLNLKTAREFQKENYRQSEHYFRHGDEKSKGRTWSGYLRAGISSIITGGNSGHERHDRQSAETENFCSLFAERTDWMTIRSLASIHTAETDCQTSPPDFLRDFQKVVLPYLAGSPVCVAYYFASMFEHNVLSHSESSFEDLDICPETGKVVCGGMKFDCILGSPIIPTSGTKDPKCQPGGTKENIYNKSAFAKGRLFQMPSGELCGATELGVAGHGVIDHNMQGEPVLKEADWLDTDSLPSLAQQAPTIVKYIFCKAALKANGSKDPAAEIDNRYRATWMSEERYTNAVNSLSAAFYEFHAIVAYCKFCKNYSQGDSDKFAEAFDYIASGSSISFATAHDSGPDSCGGIYLRELQEIAEFVPKSREKFYDEYIDFTPDEMHQVWNGICDDVCKQSC